MPDAPHSLEKQRHLPDQISALPYNACRLDKEHRVPAQISTLPVFRRQGAKHRESLGQSKHYKGEALGAFAGMRRLGDMRQGQQNFETGHAERNIRSRYRSAAPN